MDGWPDHNKTSQAAFSNMLEVNSISISETFYCKRCLLLQTAALRHDSFPFLLLREGHIVARELLDRTPCPVIHEMEIWHSVPMTFTSAAAQAAKSQMPNPSGAAQPRKRTREGETRRQDLIPGRGWPPAFETHNAWGELQVSLRLRHSWGKNCFS